MKLNWSVVLIGRNEEHTLPRLLESLTEFKNHGGEVVLVDTGSSDRTAEVARKWGCKVEEVGNLFRIVITPEQASAINEKFVSEGEQPVVQAYDSLFDFSSARNYAASLASNDMVSMPDCDEVFTKLDLEQVSAAISSGVEQLEYNFVFSHDQFGNEVIKFMHSKFYNRRKLKWVGIVHEVLSGEANRAFLPEQHVKLEHWQNEKTNRTGYLRGLALDCFLNPENDRNSHYFGRELFWSGRLKSAVKELMRHIEMNAWQPERSQSAVFIGDAFAQMGDEEQAVYWWHKAFAIEAGRREPLIRLAEFYFRKNDYQRTAVYAAASLEIPEGNFYANDAAHYRQIPHELLYWAKWYLGDKSGSADHYFKALEYQPLFTKYLHDARFYVDLPKVSFILPHMGTSETRKAGLKRCLDSIHALNYPQELIDICVLEDTLEDHQGVPKRVAEGFRKTRGEYLVYASNDVEFTPNSLILAVLKSRTQRAKGLIAFNTGELLPDEGNICEHFLIERTFVDNYLNGEIFDTEFHHIGVDNLLWAKAKALGEAVRCDEAVVIHNHFSHGAEIDDVYRLGWQEMESDRALLKKKLALI